MPKRYTQDFKDMLIELHNAGKGPAELSKDYDVPVATLGKWFTDASQEENRQVSSAEVAQLKADLLLATQENEILKKALAWIIHRISKKQRNPMIHTGLRCFGVSPIGCAYMLRLSR